MTRLGAPPRKTFAPSHARSPVVVLLVVAFTFTFVFVAATADAVETVEFRESSKGGDGATREIVGEVLVEAQDGGLMLRSNDGRIWTVQPDQIVQRESDDLPFVPIDADEMERRMLEEMPDRFRIYRTANYLFVHDADDAYVKRVGQLFERLHRGFYTYWRNQGWRLPDAKFPLVAVVLRDHETFVEHAGEEIGETAKSVIGYYHLESNRVTTFHVRNLERNIATIIHEATHQLAYNCGMQQRFADNPMWVSEGLAMYFESPDFNNPRGWRSIGLPNHVNLARWKRYLPKRPAESLATLISEDSRFRSSTTAENAYAEAWALSYFLIKTQRPKYVEYLRQLSECRPLATKTKRERIEMFEEAFDADLATIDRAMVQFINHLR